LAGNPTSTPGHAVHYLGLALWVTTVALTKGTGWSYRRLAQRRRDRATASLRP
jgi:hypothetical protein